MQHTPGFWTELGAAASVDWCEPNYTHTAYVAELWNTLTSLPMVALGLYGLWRARRFGGFEGRFLAAFFGLAVVGAGSTAFHATILQVAQAADELPMIYCGLVLLYALVNRDGMDAPRERRWQVGMAVYAALFTLGYFALTAYFTFFVWTYGAIVAALVVGSFRVAFRDGTGTHRALVLSASGSYLSGFVVFWLPEHVLLGCDHPAQALQLHAVWHILAGAGTYLLILLVLWDRLVRLERSPVLDLRAPAPFVRPG